MSDGEHDASFRAFERDRVMGRAGVVDEIIARAVLAAPVAVAALKDENLFDAAMPVRGVGAARQHADEDGGIARRLVVSQDVYGDAFVSRRPPLDF